MIKQDENIPATKLIQEVRSICRTVGKITTDNHLPFYGEIVFCIQQGKLVYVRRNETMK